MSSLSATQSDGYYLPPEYYDSGHYKKVSRNRFAVESEVGAQKNNNSNNSTAATKKIKIGHNQWLKHGIIRFELPEKVVCYGCQNSIGRGTRYNAKKIKTDQLYFTTPIYEFQLSCRKCHTPWRIRTDPKERGFAYLSGVKRQAGQVQRNLLTHDGVRVDEEGKKSKTGTPTTTAAAAAHTSSSLERLEIARVSQSIVQTDREELAALRILNRNSAGNEGQDVDHNAWIRTGFRQERKDYRTQLQGATTLGWKPGMLLLPKNYATITNTNYLQDVLVSKEVCYGTPASTTERTQFQTVRQSSIFATTTTTNCRKHRLSRRRKAKQRKQEQAQELLLASSNNSNNTNNNNNNTRSPDIVKSSVSSKQHPRGIVKREENCDVNFPPMSTVSPPKPTTYDDDATSSSLRSEHIIPVTVVSSSSNDNNDNNNYTSRLVTTTTTNTSSSSLSSNMPMKKLLKLSHNGRGIVSIATVTTTNQNKDDNNNNVNHDAPKSLVLLSSSSSSSKEGNIVKENFDNTTKINPKKLNTLLELVGGYGTSSDEDE